MIILCLDNALVRYYQQVHDLQWMRKKDVSCFQSYLSDQHQTRADKRFVHCLPSVWLLCIPSLSSVPESSVLLSDCHSTWQSICPSVNLSVCPSCLFVRPVCLSVTYVFPSSWLPSLFFCCLSLNAWCKINHPRSLAFPGIGVISRTDPVIPVRYENHIICVFWFLQLISVFVCSVIIDKNIIDNNR